MKSTKQTTPMSFLFRAMVPEKWNLSLFLIALLLCFGLSVMVRYQQFATWKETPQQYFVENRPLMATLDAPFFLRWAREYNQGTYQGDHHLRNYPDNTIWLQQKRNPNATLPQLKKDVSLFELPLLSAIIATLSPFFENNYYLTGTLLIPIFASLFILPLGLYFYNAGYPAAGLLGGLLGTFCAEYLIRSSIGRIDTDMLNLFFPAFSSWMILLACQSPKAIHTYIYSILSGLGMLLFWWWYNRPGFTIAYFCILIVSLAIYKKNYRTLLISAFLFMVFVTPPNLNGGIGSVTSFIGSYWNVGQVKQDDSQKSQKSVVYPNVYQTVSEAERVPMTAVLEKVLNSSLLGWIGFLLFAILMVCKWRSLLPITPFLLLGLMSFRSSRRFIMFLAPFIGIGIGLLILISVRLVFERIQAALKAPDSKLNQKQGVALREPELQKKLVLLGYCKQGMAYLAIAIFFWAIHPRTAISFVPSPSIPTAIYTTFMEAKKRMEKNGVLFTWWDFGYALADAIEVATFHDGGGQNTPKTTFIARALISNSQQEMYDIIKFLATEGNSGLHLNQESPQSLFNAIQNSTNHPKDPIYPFFTFDMIGKFSAIYSLGSWNFDTLTNSIKGHQRMNCHSVQNSVIQCNNVTIDMNQGVINGKTPLKRVVQIMRGKVIGEKKFKHAQGYTVQIMMTNPQQFSNVYLLEEEVFFSNFNQMFLLGRYDPNLFEEIYNASPASRLYRMK